MSLIGYYESSLEWVPPSNDRDIVAEQCGTTSTKVRMVYPLERAVGVVNIQVISWYITCVDRYIIGCRGVWEWLVNCERWHGTHLAGSDRSLDSTVNYVIVSASINTHMGKLSTPAHCCSMLRHKAVYLPSLLHRY